MLIWLCDKAACWFIVWGVLACPNVRVAVRCSSSSSAPPRCTLAAYSAYAKRGHRSRWLRQRSVADRRIRRAADFQSRRQDQPAARQTALTDGRRPAQHTRSPRLAPRMPAVAPARRPIRRSPQRRRFPQPRSPPVAEPKPVDQVRGACRAGATRETPRQLLPPPPPHRRRTNGLLDDGQIAGLKGRLRLTSDQAEYWPAVEAALRDVVRTQLRGRQQSRAAARSTSTSTAPKCRS